MNVPLPAFVTKVRKEIGVQPKGSSSKNFIRDFLLRHIESSKTSGAKSEIDDEQFRFRTFYMGNYPATNKIPPLPRKKKSLSSKEKKKLKIYEIPADCRRYELYEPMNGLWNDYMCDLVNFDKFNPQNSQVLETFLKADYHGCHMKVTKSKCSSLIGTEGILVQETKNTFKLITKDDKLKVIPKKNSVFTYEIKGYEFNINGNQFLCRTADRSTHKFGKFIKFPLNFSPL
ncbi:ribonuclease P protein subunit p29-like [Tubulanus polymorphus]|uniref:ribonuclease P protein subunit p29-like n=1 Tax=Tubulanus polymorphus TaxID=672921 RepID=UPI003DA2787B